MIVLNSMFQLVLQWPASSITDYDAMVEIEDALIGNLPKQHSVDGHDAGSGQVNIFIHTPEPTLAFDSVKTILSGRDAWEDARVAYREVDGDQYTILWPEDLTSFAVR